MHLNSPPFLVLTGRFFKKLLDILNIYSLPWAECSGWREGLGWTRCCGMMCSCWREHACTYNSHSFGLLPGFQAELFPWNLVNGQNFFCFQGKSYHKMASILTSTLWQICLVGGSCTELCRSFSWISEPWERVQLPVGTCSSQLANLGTLGNALFHLPSSVFLPGVNSSCLFADQFRSKREFQAHTRACALSCASGQKFFGITFPWTMVSTASIASKGFGEPFP